ncbi:hypothetical protein CDCA_CDCA08G2424 [Cyanidium caldarium]|uniref:AMP-dependent synthetase/ligase domain-containing protein n=1 Tax=Cyanidium caldarium TaxID=2771 RepID=A0AAV9IVT7_CYACA|nr:hypothetical protein CDCA_CDCA08G2424 [Cyanidium caldarium]
MGFVAAGSSARRRRRRPATTRRAGSCRAQTGRPLRGKPQCNGRLADAAPAANAPRDATRQPPSKPQAGSGDEPPAEPRPVQPAREPVPLLALERDAPRRRTILNRFFDNVNGVHRPCADAPALGYPVGGAWQTWSWAEYGELVSLVAHGLRRYGFRAGDHATVLSGNRPEWLILDLAVMCLGGATAGVYPNDTLEQVSFIQEHFRAKVALVDSQRQLDKLLASPRKLSALQLVVLLDASPVGDAAPGWAASLAYRSSSMRCKTIRWAQLLAAGRDEHQRAPRRIEEEARAIPPSQYCMTVYTSGTTGAPKGACYTHRNLYFMAEEISRSVGSGGQDVTLSFLPLCHVAERIQGELLAIYDANTVYFSESIAAVKEHLVEVRPTLFLSVPRLWEKLRTALCQAFAEASWLRSALIRRALQVGARVAEHRNSRREERPQTSPLLAWQWRLLSDSVVRGIRRRLGFDRCHTFASGAAPLSQDVCFFFASLGMDICELYGQSESTGVIALCPKGAVKPGTVGLPLRGTQVVLGEEGEIRVKGDNVFAGYYRDAAATAAVIDDLGFLRTGDVGRFDEDGYLVITDRLKELIKTSGGKYVAPQLAEAQLREHEGIAQAVMIGDRMPYCVALVCLDETQLRALLRRAGVEDGVVTLADAARDRRVLHLIQTYVDAVNAQLPSYATIKYFRILPHELSVEGGEMTPTLKIKRRVVQTKYAQADTGDVSGERVECAGEGG